MRKPVSILLLVSAVVVFTGSGAFAVAAERQGETIAVASSDYSNSLEHDSLVASIGDLGYPTVDVTNVFQAWQAGAHALVVYPGGYNEDGLLVTDLDAWVSSGRGLIQIGDWHDYFPNDYEGRLPTPTSVIVVMNNLTHPVAVDVAASWLGEGFFYYGWPDGAYGYTYGTLGETDLANLSADGFAAHDFGIAAHEIGGTRVVYFGLNLHGPAAGVNEQTLLSNALGWVVGNVTLDSPLFYDDFETNGTSAWSNVVP